MKIIIPILGFGRAGGYRVLSNLATKWVEAGNQVAFLVNEFNELPYFPTLADIIWIDDNGIQANKTIDFIPKGVRGGRRNGIKNLLSLVRGLNIYAGGFDLILANHSLTAWPVYLCNKKVKKAYYIQAYEPEYYEVLPGVINKILRIILMATYFFPLQRIVNSKIYFNYKVLRSRCSVPPGIDFSVFRPDSNSQQEVKKSCYILGCIGRKEPFKGVKYVIEAYKIMLERKMPVRLKIAYGNLPEDVLLEEDLYDVVVPQNDRELADYYRSLDLMIAPGLVQLGAPHYPVMEAMACGIPVVNTGYMPANSYNSWIVPTKDSESIVLAVKDILSNANGRRNKIVKALEDIQVFSWVKVSEDMLKYFEL